MSLTNRDKGLSNNSRRLFFLFFMLGFVFIGMTEAESHSEPSWVTEVAKADRLEQRIIRSKTLGSDVSYHIYTPEDYDKNTSQNYPVIYWLHGSNGGSKWIPEVLSLYSHAMQEGVIPPCIIVFPNGLENSMWADSKDNKTPVESIIIKDLIPDVDAHYRTISNRKGRLIEGFSMGGYGAARLGFKYPEVFGSVSMLSAGPMQKVFSAEIGPKQMAQARTKVLEKIYGDDQEYFYKASPWYLTEKNQELIKSTGMIIRMVVGDKDDMLDANKEFSTHLEKLGIKHQFLTVPDAGHNVLRLFSSLCHDLWPFYSISLSPEFVMKQGGECPKFQRPSSSKRENGPRGKQGNDNPDERRHRIVQRLKSFDENGDGFVDNQEISERASRIFRLMDANGDGKLDDEELNNFESNGIRH